MTRTEFYVGLGQYIAKYVGRGKPQRHGQACFNYLDLVRHDLAIKIVGTDADPYNNNDLLGNFFTFVEEHWDD